MAEIRNYEALALTGYPKRKAKTILVGGCFDLLHYGHLHFLQQAKNCGEHLIVALEPDEKILKTKNRAPIHSALQRAEILAELRCVDEVIMLPMMNSLEEYMTMTLTLQPDVIAVTAGDTQYENKMKQAIAVSADLIVVNEVINTLSSSKIISEFS